MKKIKSILIIVGLLLMIIPYFIHIFSIYRLISLALGIIVLMVGICLQSKGLAYKIPLYLLILLIGSLSLDYVNYALFKSRPIIAFKVKSSDKVATYNSFFYRIYDCDGKYTLDDYNKNYQCAPDDVETISINQFLENPAQSYKEYKNKFVRLEGKIGSIIGASSLTLNAYTEAEEVKNGYVTFDLEKSVSVNELDIDPKNYFNYDYVDIIGRVDSFEDNDKQVIYLDDAIVVDNHIYDEYELIVNNISTNDVTKAGDIYYVGINSIFYKYREDILYELDYLLSDKRESIDNLIKDSEEEKINDGDLLYKLKDYKIILCDNKNTLIVNNRINKYDDICEIKEN